MQRQEIEKKIARKVIDDALAAGYTIDVFDGEDYPLRKSADAEAIFNAMFSTDDDRLDLTRDGKVGSVWLIYGNDGWDVISNYSMSLEPMLKGAEQLADELERAHA